MASSAEREVVLTHAVASKENLEVALLLGNAFWELCGRIIVRFSQDLAAEVARRLGAGWEVTAVRETHELAMGECELVKCRLQDHPAGVHVSLGVAGKDYPKQPYLAVWPATAGALEPELARRLKERIDQEYGFGKPTTSSVWFRSAEKPYSRWGGEDEGVLLQLYGRGEAVTHFADRLQKIAEILSGVLADPRLAVSRRPVSS